MHKFWFWLLFWVFPANALQIIDSPQTQELSSAVSQTTEQLKLSPIETLATADIATINRLLADGLQVNARDKNGYTPLYYVLKNNPNLAVAKRLIAAGADVNAPMKDGTTPLIIATSQMKILRLEKKQLETSQINNISAFPQQEIKTYVSEQKKHAVEMLQMLIDSGADVNQETPFGTPLMNAATDLWNIPLIKILLQAGAAVNKQDQSGKTALFYARAYNCDDIETLLIKSGASTDILDRYGHTYIDVESDI
ncbi:MAG: ankyrin repeat domain-containing protein [Alphaproteobacteria bacterium]|nr:ankyrin repeat domain-containing protein [Alphaproteobacteria bacterium]